MGASATGGQKMAEFMDENRPAEEDDDEEERPGVGEKGLKVGRHDALN